MQQRGRHERHEQPAFLQERGRVRYQGRYILLLAGLGLLAWAGYELSIRLDDFTAWLSGVRHLSEVRNQPFLENLWIMMEDEKMAAMVLRMGFLSLAVLLGLLCLFFHNRRRWSVVFLICSLAMILWGIYQGFLSGSLSGMISLILLLGVFAGSLLNRATPVPGRQETPSPPYFRS